MAAFLQNRHREALETAFPAKAGTCRAHIRSPLSRGKHHCEIALLLLLFTINYSLFTAPPAFAACSNPAGAEGEMLYNDASSVMQYCDNTNWIAMGPVPGSGGGGCSNPAGTKGHMLYNAASRKMQYCDGSVWRAMGGAPAGCTASAQSWTSSGLATVNVPAGCNAAVIETWGAGGGGGFGAAVGTRAGAGGGGSSAVQRNSNGVVLAAAGGGGGGGATASHFGGGGGAYVTTDSVYLTAGEQLNVYVGGGGVSACTGNVNGAGGAYNGSAGSDNSTASSSVYGGGGGNSDNGDGGASTYGGGGGETDSGSGGTSVYGGAGGNGAVGSGAAGGIGGAVTAGGNGSGATGGTGASGGGLGAGNGANGNLCGTPGGDGRVRITWQDLSTPDLSSGLAAHWKLDETSGTTATDATGVNNGSMQGGLDAGADSVEGVIGSALHFTAGTSDYIRAADHASLDFGTGDFTYSVWIKTTQDCTGNKVYIGQRNDASYPGVWLGCFGATDIPRFEPRDTNSVGVGVNGSAAINDGQWHHLVGVKEGHSSAIVRLYVDGVLVNSGSASYTGTFNNGDAFPTHIGRFNVAPFYYADADIDDARIYNRALSAAEILAMYQSALPPIPADMAGHWKLDESGNTNIAVDATGTNNGTLMAFPADETANWVAGVDAGALDFDGTDDYVTMGNAAALSFERTSPFSVTAWIKRDTANTRDGIWSKEGGACGPGIYLEVDDGTNSSTVNALNLELWNQTTNQNIFVQTPAGSILAGQWYHVAATYDGGSAASGVKLYVNGVMPSLNTIHDDLTSSSILTTANAIIGSGCNGSSARFDGKIDDVRVYSRALSALEIAAIYLGTIGTVTGGTCASPAGTEGTMFYNDTSNVMQYCNGANWVGVGK